MPNMSPKKNEMPTQAPEVRAHNFNEVATGYSEETALDEALRCLNCPKMPCVSGCPVNIHIPEFIAKIRENDFEGAYQVIQQTSSLPAVCGRVYCPSSNGAMIMLPCICIPEADFLRVSSFQFLTRVRVSFETPLSRPCLWIRPHS